jgi:hypothetical protein
MDILILQTKGGGPPQPPDAVENFTTSIEKREPVWKEI